MQPLLSERDSQLLEHHRVMIETDSIKQTSIIVYNQRRFSIKVLRVNPETQNWQNLPLDSRTCEELAKKIAVMLLKKEILQTSTAEMPLQAKINKEGITRLSDHRFFPHEGDSEQQNDYTSLVSHLLLSHPASTYQEPTAPSATAEPVLSASPPILSSDAPITPLIPGTPDSTHSLYSSLEDASAFSNDSEEEQGAIASEVDESVENSFPSAPPSPGPFPLLISSPLPTSTFIPSSPSPAMTGSNRTLRKTDPFPFYKKPASKWWDWRKFIYPSSPQILTRAAQLLQTKK